MQQSAPPNVRGPRSSPSPRGNWATPGVFGLLGACVCAYLLHRWIASDYAAGIVHWDAWRHRPIGDWAWTPFIHPPPYGEFLRLVEGLAAASCRCA